MTAIYSWELAGRVRNSGPASGGSASSTSLDLSSATVARSSGVAPLFVHFDATGITSDQSSVPFHEVSYFWDFGDPTGSPVGGTTWAYGARGGSTSRNSDRGPVAGHVYENIGTHTATLHAFDGVNYATRTFTITTTDPASGFTDAQTCYFSTSGTAGSGTHKIAWVSQVTFNNAIAAGYRRLLFNRGDTFPISAQMDVDIRTGNTPGLIGAFGTGAAPVIYCSSSFPGRTSSWTFNVSSDYGGLMADWRIMDFYIDASYFSDAPAKITGIAIVGGCDQLTVLRVVTDSCVMLMRASSSNIDSTNDKSHSSYPAKHNIWDQFCIQDCQTTNARIGAVVYAKGFIDDGTGGGYYTGTAGTVLTVTSVPFGAINFYPMLLTTLGSGYINSYIGTDTLGQATYRVSTSQAKFTTDTPDTNFIATDTSTFPYSVYYAGERTAVMGNSFDNDAPAGARQTSTSHVLRMTYGAKFVIAHNDLKNPGAAEHHLKIYGTNWIDMGTGAANYAEPQGVTGTGTGTLVTGFIDDGSGSGTYTGNKGGVLTLTAFSGALSMVLNSTLNAPTMAQYTNLHSQLTGTTGKTGTYCIGDSYVTMTNGGGSTPCVVSVTIGSGGSVTPHGYSAGRNIAFASTASLPAGVNPGQCYYVIAAGMTSTEFQFSATLGGSPVISSSAGSGAFRVALAQAVAPTSDMVSGYMCLGVKPSLGGGYARWGVIYDNYMEGRANVYPIALGPHSDGVQTRQKDLIVDSNWLKLSPIGQRALNVWSTDVTVRNNLIDTTLAYTTHWYIGIFIGKRNKSYAVEIPADHVYVYNNTVYSGAGATAGAGFQGVFIEVNSTNISVKNLLTYAPGLTTPVTLSGDRAPDISGGNWADPLVSPSFVTPMTSASGWMLQSGSAAKNGGVPVPVWTDFAETDRPVGGTYDIGAYEQ